VDLIKTLIWVKNYDDLLCITLTLLVACWTMLIDKLTQGCGMLCCLKGLLDNSILGSSTNSYDCPTLLTLD
jgi:hypothetical protein